MRHIAALFLAVVLAQSLAAGDGTIKRTRDKMKDEYIVTLKKDVRPELQAAKIDRLLREHGGRLQHVYKSVIYGFSAYMTEAQAFALSHHPAVESVEENGIVRTSATVTEATSEWHLDRIDQPTGTSGTYTYCTTQSPALTNPIVIWIFDTGMQRDHPEFLWRNGGSHPWGGAYRVSYSGNNYVPNSGGQAAAVTPSTCPFNGDGNNAYTHGTAVASVAAGLTYGVAKNAFIHPVRVVGCNQSTSVSQLVLAIEYVYEEAFTSQTHVANFSLYQDDAPDQGALDTAVNALIDHNFVVVTSANNQNTDRCANQSPARVPRAITVGGTTNNPMDRRISLHADPCPRPTNCPTCPPTNCGRGSNYGSCVDIFAPGFGMSTARIVSRTERRTDTAATSYASGLVSGVAARYLEQHPTATPDQVWTWIRDHAFNVVTDSRSPHSRLVNVVPECP